ncbi:MAG: T9SS type A sorting domain-containing protein, partial [Bacteroidota bacterium]
VLSDAPYVDNNSGWYVSGRYLHLPAGLSGQNLIMRVYYDKTDLDDLDQALMPQLRQGPLDLTPYAIAGEADPRDEHASVDVSEFNWYEAHARGDVDQWAVWQDSNLQAAVLEPMGAQTIGLGSGGLGRGYGPQYPKLVPELSGALVQGKPVLSWDTEREWDLEDFVVMRSRNGGTFEKTGLLAANRDGLPWPMTRSYDWKGDTLGAGSYRYFVKGLHGSGWSWYSDTITLEKGPEPTAEFLDVKVFPNPARDQIKIDLTVETATPVTLQILDGMRRSVRQYAWTQQPGEIPTMSLQGLQPGIYFYQISNGPQVRQGKLLVFFR